MKILMKHTLIATLVAAVAAFTLGSSAALAGELSSPRWNLHIDLPDRWEEPKDVNEEHYPQLVMRFDDKQSSAMVTVRVWYKWRYNNIDEYVDEWLLDYLSRIYNSRVAGPYSHRVREVDRKRLPLGSGEMVTVIFRRHTWETKWTNWTALAFWETDIVGYGTPSKIWYWVWIYDSEWNSGVDKQTDVVPQILANIHPKRGHAFGIKESSD